jgi:ABC-type lipoprotein release transport system permease subunit
MLLGKTPILRDVSIGIRSSELNRSMNQLGLIVILTISIATLAVSQGHTGSIVDQRSADASAGADLQINLSEPLSEIEVSGLLDRALDQINGTTQSFELQALASIYKDRVAIEGQRGTTDIAVVSRDHREVLNWHSHTLQQGIGLDQFASLSSLGFTSGSETAKTLDLVAQSSDTVSNLFSPFNDSDKNQSGFDSVTLMYPPANDEQRTLAVSYIGGHKWIPGMPTGIVADQVLVIDETTFRQLNDDTDYKARYWFAEFCNEQSKICGNFLKELRSQILLQDSVVSATDWQTEYDEVKRNGGLIFGTPGILTLQYVVAVFAALASSIVFLSLILSRRRRELAILQSIGASVSQLSRLVVFEVISVFTFSLLLGGLLGMGVARTFTGLFSIFGGLFQLLLQSQVIIDRELVWPWAQLLAVNGLVFVVVFIALLLTTFQSIRSDLPTVLKEE